MMRLHVRIAVLLLTYIHACLVEKTHIRMGPVNGQMPIKNTELTTSVLCIRAYNYRRNHSCK